MRILHLVTRSQRRGAELVALELARALDGLGCEDRVIALARAFDGSAVDELPSLTARSDLGVRTLFASARALRRELARDPVDIVLAHGGRAAEIAVLARRGSSPRVVWQRILGVPPRFMHPLRRGWSRLLLRRADAAVALTGQLENEMRQLGFKGRVWRISNFRDPTRFEGLNRAAEGKLLRGELGIGSDEPLIGFVGHLIAQKRPDRAVEVLSDVHRLGTRAHLVIAGDGPLRASIERRVADRHLDGFVHVLGEREDVEHIFGGVDVFVLTSDDEGVPGVLIEAQMAGCPVVAPPIGGVRDVIEDGVTGTITARTDASEMAIAVVDLLDDRERRTRMVDAARARASRFTTSRAARIYADCLAELVNCDLTVRDE
ncbi:MAG TPA: glycosyltransferase [Acidimicrobiia bacterium]|nr:glycosyltransferase [Acidimicrobiia bacterium]